MELRYLRYFVAVAQRQSFTAAAADLRVAQSAISQQIKTLEQELEVSLLQRNQRHVRLTAAGEAFLLEAREILARAEQSKLTARRAARGEVGTLRIGCLSLMVSHFLPPLIQAYRRRFPGVRVQLLELSALKQLHAFAAREIDVGFLPPIPRADAPGFIQWRMHREKLFAVLPTGHPLAKEKDVHLPKLAHEDFVLYRRSEAPAAMDRMIGLCARVGFAPRIVSEPALMQTVLMMVASGLGVSLVPGSVRRLTQPGAVFLPVRPACPGLDLMLAWPRDRDAPLVAAWVKLVRERMPARRPALSKRTNAAG